MAALERLHKSETIGDDNKTRTYYYNSNTELELMEKIDALLKLRLANVEIDLIGLYIWVTGDTRPVKDQIKSVGDMGWNSKRGCWFYKAKCLANYKPRYSGKSLNDLANKYGSRRYNAPTQEKLS